LNEALPVKTALIRARIYPAAENFFDLR